MTHQSVDANCVDHVHDVLSQYIDHDLTDELRQQVDVHLATCARCRSDLATLRLTVTALRALPDQPISRAFTIPVTGRRAATILPWLRLSTGALAAAFVALLAARLLLPATTQPTVQPLVETVATEGKNASGSGPLPAVAVTRAASQAASSARPAAPAAAAPTQAPAAAPTTAPAAAAAPPAAGSNATRAIAVAPAPTKEPYSAPSSVQAVSQAAPTGYPAPAAPAQPATPGTAEGAYPAPVAPQAAPTGYPAPAAPPLPAPSDTATGAYPAPLASSATRQVATAYPPPAAPAVAVANPTESPAPRPIASTPAWYSPALVVLGLLAVVSAVALVLLGRRHS